jgi:hypothetical protein
MVSIPASMALRLAIDPPVRVFAFRHEVERHWGRSLARRNGRRFAWERFKATLTRWPLPARVPRSACPSEPAT